MYNVVEKLRNGEVLTDGERNVHELAACGVLRDLHEELDQTVAVCYGWSWPMDQEEILERLVTLHDERVAEEKGGLVRWLRPEYQVPYFATEGDGGQVEAIARDEASEPPLPAKTEEWPTTALAQLAGIKEAVARVPGTAQDIARRFRGGRLPLVERHLETLLLLADGSRSPGGVSRSDTHLRSGTGAKRACVRNCVSPQAHWRGVAPKLRAIPSTRVGA